ncbi:hypothetical protein BDA96_04G375100 [Sorghum bicolor]|uniref:Uncharacterized protein n=1 Tax=Sorghum bicolor TaxID=4558 RepID=A0A921R8V1_SORBI|nr:hypothetical protein BDA96_04G375100 [Sorghum bicolor]
MPIVACRACLPCAPRLPSLSLCVAAVAPTSLSYLPPLPTHLRPTVVTPCLFPSSLRIDAAIHDGVQEARAIQYHYGAALSSVSRKCSHCLLVLPSLLLSSAQATVLLLPPKINLPQGFLILLLQKCSTSCSDFVITLLLCCSQGAR